MKLSCRERGTGGVWETPLRPVYDGKRALMPRAAQQRKRPLRRYETKAGAEPG